jgi:hypothetical protein
MSTVRTVVWAVGYALILGVAVVVARGGVPFVYQGF